MDLNWIFETVIMVGIGAIAYFMKKQMEESQSADEGILKKIEETQLRIEAERRESLSRDNELSKQITELKADMPFIYVVKEDWIRISNATDEKIKSIDGKVDKILGILGTANNEKENKG